VDKASLWFSCENLGYVIQTHFSGYGSVRLEYLLWEQGVVGSNPTTPTKIKYFNMNKNNNWWKKDFTIKSEYRSCSICMNEMTLIKSTNGDYWLCKVCNNMSPHY
jgi:hypothetical protein